KVWPMQRQWIAAQREMLQLRLLTQGIGFAVTATVWVVGSVSVLKLDLAIGTLIAFVAYQTQLTNIVNMLTNMWGQFASARAGFDLYHTIMDTHSTVTDRPSRDIPDQLRGELRFENVTFAYDETPVLNGLNLTVPAGQTVALVGRSGSGKTTLANLLLRFYDPDEGRITLDGVDIRELPLRRYRGLYGVVLQEPFLFDDSIANNLRCARPDADEEQLRRALRDARALDFVEALPDGLRARVGEAGASLSGGQRQRISIARCMLLDARFLLLDEATSALDNETERVVQSALDNLFRERTAFVIAHRLSTIRRVHRILVFDDGRLVQDGGFDDLLAREGLFRHLYSIATSTSTRDVKLDEAGFA
ncbi:MAG: ABC transporter ATP-binding protein, partial [Planctomycetota bacterium]